jgi:hypothetical protein
MPAAQNLSVVKSRGNSVRNFTTALFPLTDALFESFIDSPTTNVQTKHLAK